MLRKTADATIEHKDQKYGRQLATTCEKTAIRLRLAFGGASLLDVRGTKRQAAAKPTKRTIVQQLPPPKPPEEPIDYCGLAVGDLVESLDGKQWTITRFSMGTASVYRRKENLMPEHAGYAVKSLKKVEH